jgi:DNA-binding CsgD family transcriptional regulator
VDREQAAHELIEQIYEAALRPPGWSKFAAALSRAFDHAPVFLSVNVEGIIYQKHHVGLDPAYVERYAEAVIEGLPFSSASPIARIAWDRFVTLEESFPTVDLAATEFYKTWLAPQGLDPYASIGHMIAIDGKVPSGGISIFRREGEPQFEEADLAFANALVPHLRRAFSFQGAMDGVQRQRLALAEVVDRLPTGVILLDARRRPVITNRSADRIAALDDGFRIDKMGPHAADARENAKLQQLLTAALEIEEGCEVQATGFLSIPRPSGERPFPVMVSPLLAPQPGSATRDAVVAVFIANPDARKVSATEGLEKIYSLTRAEAELVRLLSEGYSLEEAAAARNVTVNTARSHLKHVFAKTQTNRQGELVRLVLTGVGAIREE